MKKLFAVLALLAFTPARSATTWAEITTLPSWARGASATCTTGTESAPAAATDGLDLGSFAGFTVVIEGSGAMTAGGSLLAYVRNPATGTWARAPDLDLTVAAIQYQAFAGFLVTADLGRVAFVPSGVGVSSVIYIVGTSSRSRH
jgi:hypothetical protein